MAVGVHAANKAKMQPGEGAVVLGCGPIGLATIAGLRLNGVETIVAADFSPARRKLATHMGATVTVDPRETPAIDAWTQAAGARTPVIFEADRRQRDARRDHALGAAQRPHHRRRRLHGA